MPALVEGLGQTAIPSVRAQQLLLDDLAGDQWWVDATLPMLELARRRVRALVRFVERTRRAVVYSNFADELGEGTVVDLPGVTPGTNWERFRAKARAYLRDHEDHLALQRLRRNLQLTAEDLESLEAMLIESGAGTEADIARAREESHGLGLFVRSLAGSVEKRRRRRSTATCRTPPSRLPRSASSSSSSNT